MPPILYPYIAHELGDEEADEVTVLFALPMSSGSVFVVYTGVHSDYLCATKVSPERFIMREDGTLVNFIGGRSVFFSKYGNAKGVPVLVGTD